MINFIDRVYIPLKQNKWISYFAMFCRVALALGFLPSGFVKVMGERFTSLSVNHPMGHYLEALSYTGYYYTFIGIAQMTAAVLLLIPRTVVLGALLYLPIITNICILSLAVRFDGSLISSPLMVLANVFVLCWYYDRIRSVFTTSAPLQYDRSKKDTRFPFKFFGGVFAAIALVIIVLTTIFDIKPRNTLKDCMMQCTGDGNTKACKIFCEDIHLKGERLDHSLKKYERNKAAGGKQ
jgi:uncharacterized membrane protein YphA (DoxX/SURF4 family)